MSMPVPACLTIGSSDSSGGAGIQGDIKAFASIGCYAASVIVGITAQSTEGIVDRWTVPTSLVEAQLQTVCEHLAVSGVKVGTTWSVALLETLAPHLAALRRAGIPVVIDPVMMTASGSMLSGLGPVVQAVADYLLPNSTVVTPNRREAAWLANQPEDSSRRSLAEAIVARGAPAVIISGGATESGDWFFDGQRHEHIDGVRYATGAEHGVGCAHSALMAALLAQGWSLRCAAREAHQRAAEAVRAGLTHFGRTVHPVDVLNLADRLQARAR
jgi:hydroxymethylpyrimidine/phosphomethylpyrimidine kinase